MAGVRNNGGVNQKRAAYTKPGLIALVFLGGVAGVLARELLMLLIPSVAGIPLAVFIANMLGAFLLGFLLERLVVDGEEPRSTQRLRLLLGTGFLGGFTTYSAVAQSVVLMLSGGEVWLALGYPLATIVLGVCLSWLGVMSGVARSARAGGARRA